MTFRVLQVLLGLLVGTESLRALGSGYYGNFTRTPFYVLLGIAVGMIVASVQKQTASVKFLSSACILLLCSALTAAAIQSLRVPPDVLGLQPILVLVIPLIVLVVFYQSAACPNRYFGGFVLAFATIPLLLIPVAYVKRSQRGDYAQYAVRIFRTSASIDVGEAVSLLHQKDISDDLKSIGRFGKETAPSSIDVVLKTEASVGLQLPLPVSGVTVALHDNNGWSVVHASKEYNKCIFLIPAPQGVTIVRDRHEAGWHGYSIEDGK